MNRMSRMLAVMACTGVALAAGSAVAGEVKVTVVKAGGMDALKVVRDKETGKLRAATPEEIAEMNRQPGNYLPNAAVLSRPVTTLVSRSDGSMTIKRSADDMDSLVVTRDANGKLVARHGDHHAKPAQTLPKE
jgi:hypothetical protein